VINQLIWQATQRGSSGGEGEFVFSPRNESVVPNGFIEPTTKRLSSPATNLIAVPETRSCIPESLRTKWVDDWFASEDLEEFLTAECNAILSEIAKS